MSNKYYKLSKDPNFRTEYSDKLDFDDNDEPTFESFKRASGLNVDVEKTLLNLNKEIGKGEYEYEFAMDILQDFNKNHELKDEYMATITPSKGNKYTLEVIPRTSQASLQLKETIANATLDNAIDKLLTSYGVGYSLDETKEYFGRYSTQSASRRADGLIYLISLATDNYTIEDKAEEAGHLAIGMLGKEHPLVQRLYLLIKENPDVISQVLGEDSNKDMGADAIREFMGDLVGKALKNQLEDRINKSAFGRLIDRIISIVKNLLKNINPNQVKDIRDEINEVAGQIADGFINHNEDFTLSNALNTLETLYSKDKLGNFADTDTLLLDSYNSLILNDFRDAVAALQTLKTLCDVLLLGKLSDSFYLDLDTALERLAYINTLSDLNQANKEAAQYLVYIARKSKDLANDIDFMLKDSRSVISLTTLDKDDEMLILNDATERRAFAEVRKITLMLKALDKIKSTLLSYQTINGSNFLFEDASGRMINYNLDDLVNEINEAISRVVINVLNCQFKWFLAFLTRVYGKNYIKDYAHTVFANGILGLLGHTAGNNTEEILKNNERAKKVSKIFKLTTLYKVEDTTYRIQLLLSGEECLGSADISLYASWLSSMQDCGDVIQSICKMAIDIADRKVLKETEKDRMELNNWYEDVKRLLNSTDTSIFYKRVDGKLNGYLLAPFDYGRWEKDLLEQRLLIMEEFVTDYESKHGEDSATLLATKSPFLFRLLSYKFTTEKLKSWHKIHSHFNKEHRCWEPNIGHIDKGKVDYLDPDFMALTPEQKLVLEEYYQWKEKKDSLLGRGATVLYRAPLHTGTFTQKVRNHDGLFKLTRTVAESIKDSFCHTDESKYAYGLLDLGDALEEYIYDDFNNRCLDIDRVPILGIRLRSRMTDLNTDLLTASYQYAYMCNKNISARGIVDALEVGKQVLARRKISGTDELTAGLLQSNSYCSYLRHVDRAMYNRLPFRSVAAKRSAATAMHIFNSIKSLGTKLCLSHNINPAIINSGTGKIEILKEALAGENFNVVDWAWGKAQYLKIFKLKDIENIFTDNVFNDTGERDETDPDHQTKSLLRFISYMDCLNNYGERIASAKKSFIGRLFSRLPFIFYSSTDHEMLVIPLLAMIHHLRYYDKKDHKWVYIHEMYKVKYKKDPATNKYVKDAAGRYIPIDYGFDADRYCLFDDSEHYQEICNKLINRLDDIRTAPNPNTAFKDYLNNNKDDLDEIFTKRNILFKNSISYIKDVLIQTRNALYWNDKSESAFISKAREVDNRLHGIYSRIDLVTATGTAYGSSELSMKGYSLGMGERRLSGSYFNAVLGHRSEGNLASTLKVLLDGDLKRLTATVKFLSVILPHTWKFQELKLKNAGYDKNQIANLRRTSADLWGTLITGLSYRYLKGVVENQIAFYNQNEDENNEDDNFFWKRLDHDRWTAFLEYIAYKLYLELAGWFPLTPWIMYTEAKGLINLVPPGISATYDLLNTSEEAAQAAWYYYFDRDAFSYSETWSEEEFDLKYKEVSKLNNWMWGYRDDLFEVKGEVMSDGTVADPSLFKSRPMQRFIKRLPFPTRLYYNTENYLDNIKSNEYYRTKVR